MRLRIAEIFTSVQGEGIWVGIPSTFIRVSGCNLRCVWCDTPYASWNPEGPMMDIEQIVSQVHAKHVVLTGGEPMLFDPIETLALELKARGHTITVETAGTIYRDLPCDLASISPKLAHSTPPGDWAERHEASRWKPDVIRQLVETYPYQLKFVVGELSDLVEIEQMLSEIGEVEPHRVLLMPEGTDSATLQRRARELVQPCIDRNWRLSPRWHIDLFGNTRGT